MMPILISSNSTIYHTETIALAHFKKNYSIANYCRLIQSSCNFGKYQRVAITTATLLTETDSENAFVEERST